MRVPLTVNDFLDRAESVYGARVALVDEPDQPAESWGSITYAEMARRARAQAAALDAMGLDRGARVAVVSHNSARLMTAFFGVSGWGRILVPINFRLNAEEIGYIIEHSGAEVLLVDPELDESLRGVTAKQRMVLGAQSDQDLYRFDVDPEPWAADEDATATINYTSGTTARPEGRRAPAPHDLAQRDDLRLAGGRERPRRVPAHAADVPLQRLGHAVRGHRHGRSPRRASQGRRARDPPAHRT